MAVGKTTTGSLADSLPTIIFEARQVRIYEGKMPQLVDKQTLGVGLGLTWNEVTFAQLSAQAVSEDEELNNPQQLSDTLLSITPTVIGVETLITDRVAQRISKNAYAQIGGLSQNAIQKKKDEDGLVAVDGATTQLCGAGTTLTSGYITAASYRISSNATEPGPDPIRAVFHGFQLKDLADELTAPVGTYNITDGITASVFQNKMKLKVASVEIYEDGNITIDSSDDAKGGVFSQKGIILVQGRTPWTKMKEEPGYGGGAMRLYLYDEYAYGERSSGNWLYEIMSDATTPTS